MPGRFRVNKTRDEICPGERGTVMTEMGLAIAGYAMGGVLSVVSIALLATPTKAGDGKRQRATVSCGSGPGIVGVSCLGQF